MSSPPPPPPGPPPSGPPGPPAYGYGPPPAAPKTSPLAIISLVCGILICGSFFTGLPAIVCGLLALRQISESEGRLTGRGLAIAGIVCGVITMALGLMWLLLARSNFSLV